MLQWCERVAEVVEKAGDAILVYSWIGLGREAWRSNRMRGRRLRRFHKTELGPPSSLLISLRVVEE